MNISVLGAGHWGLALADVLASNNHDVLIYGRNSFDMDLLNREHKSKYFKDKIISKKISATSNIEDCFIFSDIIVISLPVVSIMENVESLLNKYQDKIYVFTSKGLFNGKSMSYNFYQVNPNLKLAVLSGPSFSNEVMEHKFTAVLVASKDEEVLKTLQNVFSNKYFRVYTSLDLIGVEYAGAIKNVFAIVCGMIDGKNMGANTKNAMITRALSEMEQVIEFVGGESKTLHGLAGIGDIMLTCNSFESRNYSFGFNYVRNETENKGIIEGLNTIREIYNIALENKLSLPIITSLYNILFNSSDIEKEAISLMTRDLKRE